MRTITILAVVQIASDLHGDALLDAATDGLAGLKIRDGMGQFGVDPQFVTVIDGVSPAALAAGAEPEDA